jgi:hypothetical protein
MFDRRLSQIQPKRKFVLTMVFSLLLAQWLVFTHVHKPNNSSSDSLCSVCLVGQHLNHALGNSPLIITHQPVLPVAFIVFTSLVLAQNFSAFRSRAPPTLL